MFGNPTCKKITCSILKHFPDPQKNSSVEMKLKEITAIQSFMSNYSYVESKSGGTGIRGLIEAWQPSPKVTRGY